MSFEPARPIRRQHRPSGSDSERLKLVGRPDRIVRRRGSAHPGRVEVLEEGPALAYRPARDLLHPGRGILRRTTALGVIVLGDGVWKRIENTEQLRKQVLDVARRIREARRCLDSEIRV